MNKNKNFSKNEAKKLLLLATLAGRIMLKNGAETYRVEDTIERICKSRKEVKYVNAFSTPTGIFVSIEVGEEMLSYIMRIKSTKIDLNKINLVNEFSRDFVNSDMNIDEGLKRLREIDKTNDYSPIVKYLSGGLSCGFFSLLFQGRLREFLSSFLIGFIVVLIINRLSKYKMTFFISNFIGATIASLTAIFISKIGISQNINTMIISSIMPLVPGVAITNAMRDTISGDFVSGLSRAMEAIFSALAIAFGVGLVLNVYFRGILLWK